MTNLLNTLLRFAQVEEDPLTETLAWFLRTSPELRGAVLDVFDQLIGASGRRLPRSDAGLLEPDAILTQVVVSNRRGTDCRYDLVCDWHSSERVRLVIEVKVWAGLTWGTDGDPEGNTARPSHQVERYLRVADDYPEIRTHVVVLAPYVLKLALPRSFGGQVTWQRIHDAFARTARVPSLDATMRLLAGNFVQLLEDRRMAAPKLTFDALTSVYRYRRFEQSVTAMLTHARDALTAEGQPLAKMLKGDNRAWQDAYERFGWRVWAHETDAAYFAFMGIFVGAGTIHDEVPDLYFFLELRRGSPAQKAFDVEEAKLRALAEQLSTPVTAVSYVPGGHETFRFRRSLVEVARETDATDATTAFFRECATALNESDVLPLFLRCVRAG